MNRRPPTSSLFPYTTLSPSTQEATKDLRQAASYLATRPEVDGSRMIGIGLSTGGLAMLGLSADPPSGLKAAINFAKPPVERDRKSTRLNSSHLVISYAVFCL